MFFVKLIEGLFPYIVFTIGLTLLVGGGICAMPSSQSLFHPNDDVLIWFFVSLSIAFFGWKIMSATVSVPSPSEQDETTNNENSPDQTKINKRQMEINRPTQYINEVSLWLAF